MNNGYLNYKHMDKEKLIIKTMDELATIPIKYGTSMEGVFVFKQLMGEFYEKVLEKGKEIGYEKGFEEASNIKLN